MAVLILISGIVLGFAVVLNKSVSKKLLDNINAANCTNEKPNSLIQMTTQSLRGKVASINDKLVTLSNQTDKLSFTVKDETPIFSPFGSIATPSATPKGDGFVSPEVTKPGNYKDLRVGQDIVAQVIVTSKGLEASSISIMSVNTGK